VVVLVDDARWPAHGRLWAHLVSDTSLAELHAFARAAGVPARSFDADHYDVPDALVPALVAAGAHAVGGRELTRRLMASGLRVTQRARREGARRQPPHWPDPAGTAAVLLAAGAGSRFGGPKALARDDDGEPWLAQRVRALREGGCDRVLVVLGAQAERARALVPVDEAVDVVVAQDWADGMSASLRAGLAALAAQEPPVAAALVALVDTPGLRPEVVGRVLAAAPAGPSRAPAVSALARAAYAGRPGHPVLLGRAHWSAAAAAARGDRGAGPYLRDAGARLVECGDLDDGADVDRRPTLAP
jgi:CTP:molybdopterin cytidylyltransferase MocA